MSLLNLKEILVSDSVAEKLAKINYNFDILVSSSGPIGGTGDAGINGNDGTAGIEGHIGNDGPIGDTGGGGTAGESEWHATLFESNGNATYSLSPKFNQTADTTSSISIGHPDINAVSYGAVSNKSQLTIYNNTSYDSDIRLTSQGSADFFDINFNNAGLTLGFNTTASNKILNINSDDLLFSDLNNNPIISADTDNITFSKDILFQGSDVIISGGLKLGFNSPGVDKIACSSDANGTIVWKSLSEITSAIPTGMIVPILSNILTNSSNFVQTHAFTIQSSLPSEMWTGRGVGDYAGWYICNGKTWSNGVESFDTPDLNSFEYDINVLDNYPANSDASTNDGQFDVNISDVGVNIVSNSAIVSTSSVNNSNYDFTMDVNSHSTSFDIGNTTQSLHDTIKLVRVPHIIYLGETDLTWGDSGIVRIKLIYNDNTQYGAQGGSYVQTYIHRGSIRYESTFGVTTKFGNVNSDEFLTDEDGNIMSAAEYNEFLEYVRDKGVIDSYRYRFFSNHTAQSVWSQAGMTGMLREANSNGQGAYSLNTSTGFIY